MFPCFVADAYISIRWNWLRGVYSQVEFSPSPYLCISRRSQTWLTWQENNKLLSISVEPQFSAGLRVLCSLTSSWHKLSYLTKYLFSKGRQAVTNPTDTMEHMHLNKRQPEALFILGYRIVSFCLNLYSGTGLVMFWQFHAV